MSAPAVEQQPTDTASLSHCPVRAPAPRSRRPELVSRAVAQAELGTSGWCASARRLGDPVRGEDCYAVAGEVAATLSALKQVLARLLLVEGGPDAWRPEIEWSLTRAQGSLTAAASEVNAAWLAMPAVEDGSAA